MKIKEIEPRQGTCIISAATPYTWIHHWYFLPTAREGNVFTGICHSVHNWPYGHSITAHPWWLLGHCYGAVGMHSTGMLSC